MWLPFILISAIFFSTSTLFRKKVMDLPKADAQSYAIVSQFIVAAIVLVYILITKGGLSNFDFANYWLNWLILALAWGFGNLFLFKALQHTTLSKFTIIFSSSVVINVLINAFLLNEYLNTLQIGGLILILIAVGIVVINKNENLFDSFSKGEVYTLLAAICFAIGQANDRFLLKSFPDPVEFIIYGFSLPAILLAITNPKAIGKFGGMLENKGKLYAASSILLYILAVAFFNSSLKVTPSASLVTSVNQITIIFSVLLGIIFLKERSNLVKVIFASVLSLVGVVLLAI